MNYLIALAFYLALTWATFVAWKLGALYGLVATCILIILTMKFLFDSDD